MTWILPICLTLISVNLSPATVRPATLVFFLFLEHVQLILIFVFSFPPKEDTFLPDNLFQVIFQVLPLQTIILLHL